MVPCTSGSGAIHLHAFVSVLYSVKALKKMEGEIDIIKFKIVLLCAEVEMRFSLGASRIANFDRISRNQEKIPLR